MPVLVYKVFNDDGSKNDLLSKSKLDWLRFMPTFLYSSGLAQNVAFNKLQSSKASVDFEDEIIPLSDGGRICLSWNYDPERTKKGLVIIWTGLAGSTSKMYNVNSAFEAIQKGFNAVVFNLRGGNFWKITTPKFYSELSHDDFREAIDHIHAKYPEDKLYAIGNSLGASVICNYINEAAQENKQTILSGVVCISTMFNQTISHNHLENYLYGSFSKAIAKGLKMRLLEQKHMFASMEKEYGIDFEYIFSDKWARCHDVVNAITWKIAGCNNAYEYYEAAKLTDKIKNIKIKTLFISSHDDPLADDKSIPFEEIKSNQDTYLMLTHAGGHLAFYDRVFCSKQWFTIPAMQFIDCLHCSNN